MKFSVVLKHGLVSCLLVAGVAGLVRWRIGIIRDSGRAFAADRLHAISNNAETFLRAWIDDHRRLGERIGRAFAGDPVQGASGRRERPDPLAILDPIIGDDEIVAVHVADVDGRVASAGQPSLSASALKRLADSTLALRSIVAGELTARGDTLRMPISIPFCPASLETSSACLAVILDIDPRARIIEGLRGMRGAGRSSQYVVVVPDGQVVAVSHAARRGTIDAVTSGAWYPAHVLGGAVPGASRFFERVDSSGTIMYGVVRRMEHMGFGLIREATREEAMANHERQVKLEATLALTALVLIALGWLGYDRTIGAVRAQRMAAAEARLATVVRTTSDAILIIDDLGIIDVANEAAGQLLGVPAVELVGAGLDQWLDAESALAIARLHSTLEHESAALARLGDETDFRIVRRDGAVRACEASVSPTGSRIPRSYALIMRDVTARKALEQRVQQSERLAAVSRFVGGVAHELNNPLAVISLTSELLDDRVTTPNDVEDLRTMRRAALRAARIVRDLLRFIEEYPLRYKDLSVADLLADVERDLRPALEMLGVELRCPVVGADDRVNGDETALRQAVANLVMNGAQAAGSGGWVAIGVQSSDATLELRVTDSGPGVPATIEHRIFEPFFTTRKVGEGTGLGLSVSFGIISQHQGTLALERRPGPGASFLVTLPLKRMAA